MCKLHSRQTKPFQAENIYCFIINISSISLLSEIVCFVKNVTLVIEFTNTPLLRKITNAAILT